MSNGPTLEIDDEAPVLFLPLNSTDNVPQLFLPPNSSNGSPKLKLPGNKFSAMLPTTPLKPLSDEERTRYLKILADCNEKNPHSSKCAGSLEAYKHIKERSSPEKADSELKKWIMLIETHQNQPINTLNDKPAFQNVVTPYNKPTPYNYQSKNKTKKNIEKALFLCNKTTTKRSRNTNSKVERISGANVRSRSKGSYAEVLQQEVELSALGEKFSCISAIKTQSRNIKFAEFNSINDSAINEMATFSALLGLENVAQATHAKFTEKGAYLIMENYGKNLDELFTYDMPTVVRVEGQTPKPLEPAELELFIKAIMFQIITGVKNIHAQSIIHTDLKPQNCLLSYDGRVMVCDFGTSLRVVKGIDKLQSVYKKEYTKIIASPEAIIESKYDSKFDIWSVGCCLIYFLILDIPFSFRSDGKIGAIGNFGVVEISEYSKKIEKINEKIKDKYSKEIISFLNKLLILDPSKRPNAEDLLTDEWLKGITSETAINIVQTTLWSGKHGLISAKKAVNNYVSREYTRVNERRRRVIKYKQQNQNMKKTVKQYLYFLLKKSPDWKMSTLDQGTKIRAINYLFDKISNPSWASRYSTLNIDTFIHTIELLDRYSQIKKYAAIGDELPGILYVLVRLAIYTSPYPTTYKMKEVYNIKKYIKIESDILKTLSGDIFPKKNGLTDIVLNTLEITPKTMCAFLVLYALRTTETIETIIEAAQRPLTVDISSFPKIASTLAKEEFTILQNNIDKLPKA